MMNYRPFKALIVVGAALSLSACFGDMSDLETYIDQVKSRPGGRIEPLPQIKPYQTFAYSAQNLRSPFLPDRPQSTAATGPRPTQNRNKEYLEQFPLDTLDMVGTLEREGRLYGLVQTQDGLVHRVLPGNYLGQNEGKIVAVTDSSVELEELIPDGMGGFLKRSAGIGLND